MIWGTRYFVWADRQPELRNLEVDFHNFEYTPKNGKRRRKETPVYV
jgi:hypothetical protein